MYTARNQATAAQLQQYSRHVKMPLLLLLSLPAENGSIADATTAGTSVAQCLHAAGIVDTPDGLAQQVGYTEDGELWEHVLWGHGDGVGHNDFTEDTTAEALNGWGAEHCVTRAGVHLWHMQAVARARWR